MAFTAGLRRQDRVSSLSLQSDGPAGPLLGANITCRGSVLNLIGGPLLEEFAPAFVGEHCAHTCNKNQAKSILNWCRALSLN